jgi:hypothetical protein
MRSSGRARDTNEREYAAAKRRGNAERAAGLRAVNAHYDRASRRVVIELINGIQLSIPLHRLREIESAGQNELEAVEVIGAGSVLHWESLDADYGVPALILSAIGKSAVAREFARAGGSATTKAKAAAARANGAKGGRPRKSAQKR